MASANKVQTKKIHRSESHQDGDLSLREEGELSDDDVDEDTWMDRHRISTPLDNCVGGSKNMSIAPLWNQYKVRGLIESADFHGHNRFGDQKYRYLPQEEEYCARASVSSRLKKYDYNTYVYDDDDVETNKRSYNSDHSDKDHYYKSGRQPSSSSNTNTTPSSKSILFKLYIFYYTFCLKCWA